MTGLFDEPEDPPDWREGMPYAPAVGERHEPADRLRAGGRTGRAGRGAAVMKLLAGVRAGAVLSPDGTYRYTLDREWGPGYRYTLDREWGPGNRVLWIMLNPSTADADTDDPTLRRCQAFSRLWGYDALTVVNLFALRSSDPKALLTHPDPVGPDNDVVLAKLLATEGCGLVLAAWGTHPARKLGHRYASVLLVASSAGYDVYCLGRTASGQPKHPLGRGTAHVPPDTQPTMYRPAR